MRAMWKTSHELLRAQTSTRTENITLGQSCTGVATIDLARRPKQGSTLEKKPWGQLAPKFLDLVASTNFLVAKTFSALQGKDFYLN